MKVSVVVAAYNEEQYIEACIKSILHQSEPAHQIIIVDNNSTDQTKEIVKKYPVTLLEEKRQGMTPAMIRGFDYASGDIIAKTDADCIVPYTWIETIKRDFEEKKIDGLTGLQVFYDLWWLKHRIFNIIYVYCNILLGTFHFQGPNYAFLKKIWKKAKPFRCWEDKKVHEDRDMSTAIKIVGGKIAMDYSLVVKASGRRIANNPLSFLFEYPMRIIGSYFYRRKVITSLTSPSPKVLAKKRSIIKTEDEHKDIKTAYSGNPKSN